MLEVKGSKPCKALRAKQPLRVLTNNGKVRKWGHNFQVFEGLSYVKKSLEQKCFSFNQILNQHLHHPSKMALGYSSVNRKYQNADM